MAGQEEITDPPSTLNTARETTANDAKMSPAARILGQKPAEICAVNEIADCISINFILCFMIKPPNPLMAFTCAHFIIVGREK